MEINVKNRTIFCHDNLDILKGINSNSVDLIYLDPPFNKKKMFTAPIGSSAEGASFKDWFEEKDLKDEWLNTIEQDNPALHDFLNGIKAMDGRKSYNFCYLAYMAIRLIEMKRLLKETGSIYLHCDPTMSHYLKLVMDCIFGEKNFRNEIIWQYFMGGKPKKFFARKHDLIFLYTKTNNYFFKILKINRHLNFKPSLKDDSKKGKIWKNELGWFSKITCSDVWPISGVFNMSKEYRGYPTQKPITLLERIIKASCPEKGIVLDPVCGCATACVAAEKLGRKWIGIDISEIAYRLVRERLEKECQQGTVWEGKRETFFKTNPPTRTDIDTDTRTKKWVYVISNPSYDGEYKVGIAHNWQVRLNNYQTSDPNRKYKMEFKIKTSDFNRIEKHIHNKFRSRHEWVQADLKLITQAITEQVNKSKP